MSPIRLKMHNIAGLLVILVVPLPVWADGSTDPKLVDVLDFVDDYHDELYTRKGRLNIIRKYYHIKGPDLAIRMADIRRISSRWWISAIQIAKSQD